MSSTSPTTAPSTESPASNSSDDNKRYTGNNNNNNLYLVTFLATLFLLLFVSCAIVLRSYIFRRRYQRRLEEAMAAGLLLAPRAQGSKRKRFGAKPKMFDAWVTEGGEVWTDIMPIAAQPVFVKRKYKEGTGPKANGVDGQLAPGFVEVVPDAPQPPPTTPLRTGVRTFLQFYRRQPDPPTPTPEPEPVELVPTLPSTTPGSYKIRVEMLQVSVLIAMPNPSRSLKKNELLDSKSFEDDIEEDTEDPLPELAFGITRVNYRQLPKSSSPTHTPTLTATPTTTPATAAQTPIPTPTPAETPSQANYGSYF